jgi:acetaldehyde dehydrogenase (acetylating)
MPTLRRLRPPAVRGAVERVAAYVPGYRLKSERRSSRTASSGLSRGGGAGDPAAHAGNLDIMTSAAVRVAELAATEPAPSVGEGGA